MPRSVNGEETNVRYRFARVGAIAGALVLASASVAYAADTPTLGPNGDCWKSGTPYWCRTHWSGVSTSVTFQAIDQFSSQRPAWLSLAQTAVGNWSGAAGPQVYIVQLVDLQQDLPRLLIY